MSNILSKRFKLEFFVNGYGISVITGKLIGDEERPFEAAVLKGTEDDFDICYDTHLTSDVLGYLSLYEVDMLEGEIRKLPKRG